MPVPPAATRRTVAALAAMLALVATGASAQPRRYSPHPLVRHQPYAVNPAYIRVQDGDTFHVAWVTIRLRGIDAPELRQPRGVAAARRLAALLAAAPVTVVPRAADVYGRIVADVYAGRVDVADVLRREGFAKPRPRRPRDRIQHGRR